MNCKECGCEKVYKHELCEEHYKEMFEAISLGEGTITPSGYHATFKPTGIVIPYSERIMNRIKAFQELNAMRNLANDHTSCPSCGDQLYFCDCVAWEAYGILCDILNEKV